MFYLYKGKGHMISYVPVYLFWQCLGVWYRIPRLLDSESRDPVLDLETQSLEVRLPDPGVRENIVSHYTAVIFGLFSQYVGKIFSSAIAVFYLLFQSFIRNNFYFHLISPKSEITVFSAYYVNSLCIGSFFSMHELCVYTLHIYICF